MKTILTWIENKIQTPEINSLNNNNKNLSRDPREIFKKCWNLWMLKKMA